MTASLSLRLWSEVPTARAAIAAGDWAGIVTEMRDRDRDGDRDDRGRGGWAEAITEATAQMRRGRTDIRRHQ